MVQPKVAGGSINLVPIHEIAIVSTVPIGRLTAALTDSFAFSAADCVAPPHVPPEANKRHWRSATGEMMKSQANVPLFAERTGCNFQSSHGIGARRSSGEKAERDWLLCSLIRLVART